MHFAIDKASTEAELEQESVMSILLPVSPFALLVKLTNSCSHNTMFREQPRSIQMSYADGVLCVHQAIKRSTAGLQKEQRQDSLCTSEPVEL